MEWVLIVWSCTPGGNCTPIRKEYPTEQACTDVRNKLSHKMYPACFKLEEVKSAQVTSPKR